MINHEALDMTVDLADGSQLQKKLLKRNLHKLARMNALERMTPLFKYRYCAARMALGDFSDYSGWEYRSDDGWSAEIWFNEQPLQKWKGDNCGRLLVRGEQGLGDEIFYASIIPECLARVDAVVIECDDRLHGIFTRSFPRVECVSRRTDWEFQADAFITMGDLLRVFRKDKSHFPRKPYLKVDSGRVEEFDVYRGMVGIAWRGRQGSISPVGFGEVLSLQYGEQSDFVPAPPIDLKNDIEGVFALCSVLDKVITVPQTIVHIAGSIGKIVDVIQPTIEGEVINQIQWDMPIGKSMWYNKVYVHPKGVTHEQMCKM